MTKADHIQYVRGTYLPHLLAPLGSWLTDDLIVNMPKLVGVTVDTSISISRLAIYRGNEAYQGALTTISRSRHARMQARDLVNALDELRSAELNLYCQVRRNDWHPLPICNISEEDMSSLNNIISRMSERLDCIARAARGHPGRNCAQGERMFVFCLADCWVSLTGRVPRATRPMDPDRDMPLFHLFVEKAAKELRWRNSMGLASTIKQALLEHRAALVAKAEGIQKSLSVRA